ncbi:MAG: YraN family protein [Nitratireductor sp.]|nr:YraN family protein [Nitratireductor sp.]
MSGGNGESGEKRKRRRARTHGLFAERLAALALRLKGYRIVARNFRCKQGEIDIIARKGDLVAIVEVKARPDTMSAAEAVTLRGRRRIEQAAQVWLSRRPDHARLSLRFDIVAVRPWRWPAHIENAF